MGDPSFKGPFVGACPGSIQFAVKQLWIERLPKLKF